MRSTRFTFAVSLVLFGALTMPAQDNPSQDHKPKHHKYKLVDLGTLGGPTGYLSCCEPVSQILDNRGTVVGAADTSTSDPNYPNTSLWLPPDPFIMHAFQWRNGVLTDLGALSGVASSFANWISANGLIAGLSENGVIDPLLGVPEANAVLWKNGKMINLGTLEGGYESYATAVNSESQVTGSAVNTIPDPFSPFGLQNRAFLWQNGTMHDLGTLGGPDAAPGPMNERGQIAGSSYTSFIPNPVTGIPTFDPFLWENDKMVDLGTLGGTFSLSNSLNNQGQVVGQSDLAGDLTFHPFLSIKGGLIDLGTLGGDNGQANWINDSGEVVGKADLQGSQTHDAFLWKKGIMKDLGRVGGDTCSDAFAINSSEQVVGCSSDCITCSHAFLWEKGQIVDLNKLVSPGSSLQLAAALGINDGGEIAGLGLPSGCGDPFACGHALLLIPEGDCDDDVEAGIAASQDRTEANQEVGTQYPATAKQDAKTHASPRERVRTMMRQRYLMLGQRPLPLN